ncbi:hypothetical protein [Curtobacterium herbarum]|uniref:hypothetical protein n=1 Tax=Curtobacterium herbarum TaxID=150122 RepID=UPI001C8E6EA6|nr:hypothetical protein [Curtobacterium herbarum]MBY0175549.1 hypothetical protein [Curtobacterium herbarum]
MSQQLSPDVAHFVNLRKELTQLRLKISSEDHDSLTEGERDLVAIAQAEALADIAATLNAGISVSS